MGCNKGKKKVTEQLSDADSDDDFQKPIIIRKRKAKDKDGELQPSTRKRMMTAKDTADADNDDDFQAAPSSSKIVTGQGTKVPDDVKKDFEKFQDQIPSFDKEYFRSQGFMTLISQAAKQYEENTRNHVPANFQKKTVQYLLIRLSDEKGQYYISGLSTAQRRKSRSVQLNKVEAVAKDFQKEIGVEDLSESALSARPHLDDQPENKASKAFIHRNLQEILSNRTNLSKSLFSSLKVHIHNAINLHKSLVLPKSFTAPLPEPVMKDIKTFIEETSTELKNGTFRPLKYTNPRGARRFTLLPLYNFQARHVSMDLQAFSKLLLDSGLRIKKDGQVTQETAKQGYFRIFDMAKIGCKTNQIITDGYDLIFVFKKPKKEYQPQVPDSIGKSIDNPDTIVWSVDPGVTDIITSVDGVVDEPHRIRQTSANERYHLCGYNRTRIRETIESIEYRMKHHYNICEFYHREFRYNKLKFKSYVNKQKGLAEIAKRLLGGSDKYRPDRKVTSNSLDITRQNQGWHAENPCDTVTEKEKPVVVVGDGSFSGSMKGKITAPTKSVFHALKQYARQRKAPTFILKTDEYLSS
ncbi:hypothetical protein VTP01DRAFT_9383 [Rhizomucor pusillus]|uniref:uncharacterized protein n=1 Tax=Rhizomucor pusillus TaxID=4840 RepID=UPI0037437559